MASRNCVKKTGFLSGAFDVLQVVCLTCHLYESQVMSERVSGKTCSVAPVIFKLHACGTFRSSNCGMHNVMKW